MNNPKIGSFLNNLHARIYELPEDGLEFLLSDDPLIRTNGIQTPGGHIAIPISPRKLFVSAWEESTLDRVAAQSPAVIRKMVNRWQVESARHFVIACDRSQDRFIRNRFGLVPKDPILVPDEI